MSNLHVTYLRAYAGHIDHSSDEECAAATALAVSDLQAKQPPRSVTDLEDEVRRLLAT